VPRVDIYVVKGDELYVFELKTRSARETEARVHRLLDNPNLADIKQIRVMEVWVP
jgi:hypothetical protein